MAKCKICRKATIEDSEYNGEDGWYCRECIDDLKDTFHGLFDFWYGADLYSLNRIVNNTIDRISGFL